MGAGASTLTMAEETPDTPAAFLEKLARHTEFCSTVLEVFDKDSLMEQDIRSFAETLEL